jgi:hypothetical protein
LCLQAKLWVDHERPVASILLWFISRWAEHDGVLQHKVCGPLVLFSLLYSHN